MASLDVLDYMQGLDDALAQRGMQAAYRRQALKEARRAIDAMAFKFAILDERPLPEDLDYLRALEAMKPPARAAPVLERRLPTYRRVRGRRLATTGVVLLVLGSLVGGLWWLATSETAAPVASLTHAVNDDAGRTVTLTENLTVPEGATRLYVAGTIFVSGGSRGDIAIFLKGPDNQTRLYESYADRGTHYLRENVAPAEAGEWTLLVDFNGARGSIHLDVSAVSPAR
ncbi:MAG TPA: hypothetical protein VNX21_01815 [Candidatus Thermoplasmatota archaeon]|nr:hypothetical protein [Candidatus Thermoplasmatota archaeon]